MTFEMIEQSLQCSQKVVESYRELYQHGFNTWMQYLQQVNESLDRTILHNGDERR
jgi:phosphohistidine phosphatase SixA